MGIRLHHTPQGVPHLHCLHKVRLIYKGYTMHPRDIKHLQEQIDELRETIKELRRQIHDLQNKGRDE